MKSSTKVLTLSLALVLILSIFAGCASAGNVTIPDAPNALDDFTDTETDAAVLPDDEGTDDGTGDNTTAPVETDAAQPDEGEPAADDTMALMAIPEADGKSYNIPSASAPGTLVKNNAKALIDYSNNADGYIMVKYLGTNQKVKVLITGPSKEQYQYNARLDGQYDVFPLSDGAGEYKVMVYENTTGTSYSAALSLTFTATVKNEFEAYLRSNQYVNFTAESNVVKKAAELTKNKITVLEKVEAVYNYVVKNFKYDYELAKTVKSGYIPDIDKVLKAQKGICFDYAAVMTAMLRSQGIPTKLVIGNAGTAYHAWINVYSEKDGWVTASIYFTGNTWKLMDPTFASTGKSSAEVLKYIGNGANYTAKFSY